MTIQVDLHAAFVEWCRKVNITPEDAVGELIRHAMNRIDAVAKIG